MRTTVGKFPFHDNVSLFLLILCCCALFGCSTSAKRDVAQALKPPAPIVEFVGAWGTKGAGPGMLSEPRSIAADELGGVYIADTGTPGGFIHKFSANGHPLQSFQPIPPLRDPCALAVDNGGAIYVLECGTVVLNLFYPEGEFLRSIRGGLSVAARPAGVAVDDLGRIYVSEARAQRVLMFTSRGGALGSVGAGSDAHAGALTADEVAAADDGLYIADSPRRWMARISTDGSVANEWQWSAPAAAPAAADVTAGDICYLAATRKGVVLLTGPASAPQLHVFAPDGSEKFTGALLDLNSSIGAMAVGGMAATADGDLFVLDLSAPRVLRFALHL
jgi:sugar lactone lactonase YvrE